MSFSASINSYVQRAKGNIGRAVQDATAETAASLIRRSPVDTGRFVANWRVAQGAIDGTTDYSADQSGSTTLGRLVSAIRLMPAGGVVNLSNSLPYAARLEKGWSGQAPAGMIRLTAIEFEMRLRQAVSPK